MPPRVHAAGVTNLQALVALSSELLGVLGPDGCVVPANAAWERLLGLSQRALEKRAFLELIHPEERPELRAALERARDGAAEAPIVVRTRRADDGWAALSWRLSGRGVLVDIAGREIAAQRDLRQALDRLQPLAQLGRLSLAVVHDLNGLLSVIAGCAGQLQSSLRPTGQDARDFCDILHTAELGAELVHALAQAVRGEEIAADGADLNETVSDGQRLLARLLGSLQVTLALEPGVGRVRIGPARLLQALLNLAANARDAMDGRGVLRLETRRPALEPGWATLSVGDTGCGMPPDVQARLFEPFFTTKPRGQGTGLGLVSVQELMRQCGGRVSLDSRAGLGTTVTLHLPLAGG